MAGGHQGSRLFIPRADSGYYENFSVGGHRFRRSLKTDRLEEAATRSALRYAAALLGPAQYEAAVAAETAPGPAASITFEPLESGPPVVGKIVAAAAQTLEEIFGTYWLQQGQHKASAADIERMTRTLLHGVRDQRGKSRMPGLGAATPVSELTVVELRNYAARRRAMVSNRSVNCELVHLRAVLNWAKNIGVPVPEFRWKRDKILLPEDGEREHILSVEEERRLFAELRPDYHPFVRFALLSGMRLDNVVGLAWRQIDRDAGEIQLRVKGGKQKVVAISAAMQIILDGERGHNFQRVFTYVCERNRHDPKRGIVQNKGERYPFTHDGWRKAWGRALAAAGIEALRFHDLRHTFATRFLRATGNLRVTQIALTHDQISTTVRYAKVDLADVRAGMEKMQAARNLTQNLTQNPVGHVSTLKNAN
jgi:integrase